MSIVRLYTMTASTGEQDALFRALLTLADNVRALPDCTGVELYQDQKRPERFTFLEHWNSVEAHKMSGELMDKEVLAAVMALLGLPPEMAWLGTRAAI